VREGIKAILTGTIANLGKQYVVTLTAQDTATGDEIVSEQAQAPDKEHVSDALGKAAAAMRGNFFTTWKNADGNCPCCWARKEYAAL
jgi:hypothetical protein